MMVKERKEDKLGISVDREKRWRKTLRSKEHTGLEKFDRPGFFVMLSKVYGVELLVSLT